MIEPRHNPQPRLNPESRAESHDVLAELGENATSEYNIVLTARPRGCVPTALWNSSYFIFLGADPGIDDAKNLAQQVPPGFKRQAASFHMARR
jgi:hypothetical protein